MSGTLHRYLENDGTEIYVDDLMRPSSEELKGTEEEFHEKVEVVRSIVGGPGDAGGGTNASTCNDRAESECGVGGRCKGGFTDTERNGQESEPEDEYRQGRDVGEIVD